jgi:hypothetical protein
MHLCADCGSEIAKPPRGPFANRCIPCNTIFRKTRPDKQAKPRFCKDCGNSVPPYRHYCTLCADARQRKNVALFQKKQQLETAKRLRSFKEQAGCALCGESFPPALDFHHREPSEKHYEIGRMTNRNAKTVDREIEKCIVLCATCHRKIHGPLSSFA